jgi:hypothetical protein
MKKYRFIKSVIRHLKNKYGQTVTLKNLTPGTINWSSGSVSGNSIASLTVKRVIVLPSRTTRKFAYDIGYLAANKNFTYGGFYDVNQRDIIIDEDDLRTFVLDMDSRLNFGGHDYCIKELCDFEESNAKYLVVVKVEGQSNES